MYKVFLKTTGILLLLSAPLTIMGLWISWYNTTFNYASNNSNNIALAELYGKADICKNKDSLLGQYALTCTNIYSFCNTSPPNIERGGGYETDKTEACEIYMNATRPFYYFFIPTIIFSLLAFGVGVILIIKAILRFRKKP